ncbi:MAG: tyrosine-protein phosphatase [bacterium]
MMTIKLIEPADQSVTRPLQRYTWPVDDTLHRDRGSQGGGQDPIQWNNLRAERVDLSEPAGVLFSWAPIAPLNNNLSYDLRISRQKNFREALLLKDLTESRVEVLHLHIATRYYWKVRAHENGVRLMDSPVQSFVTHDTPPRWISVPGITNVRDLGGWPLPGGRRVRQGMLYRSSEMNSHLTITEEGKVLLMDSLGIRTDLDLRSPPEEVRPVLDPARVEWINVPIQPYDAICVPECMPAYRQLFTIFADASKYPILFHCWGGADRAGTVAFLLSALLGKDLDHLVKDYELTSLSIWGERSQRSGEFQRLRAALASFDDGSGSVNSQAERYLHSIGVTRAEIGTIRELLIEPDHAS